ncbi:MAG: response regulator [Alphaproteobacteria bacterium]|jgi:CheY-like chemotaxis protein|nr:response regulator [Alphaproteobacteria bacterium]
MSLVARSKRYSVLLADDDEEDAFTVRRGFTKSDLDFEFTHLSDGEELLAYLEELENRSDDSNLSAAADGDSGLLQPDLILLDINMPRMNGFEVLDRMRSNPKLAVIPVVILTSSNNDADVSVCYSLGARSYFVKPLTLSEMAAFVESIANYWFRSCRLPTKTM